MKQINIKVSTVYIRFQTWNLSYALSTIKFLFPTVTEEQLVSISNEYTKFSLNDSISSLKNFPCGGDMTGATITFTIEE